MRESFKVLREYDNYAVSNQGRVMNVNTRRILKPSIISSGYKMVILYINKKQKGRTIHSLVAEAFLNHTPNKYEFVVNHIDRDKLNNNLNNLEVVTNRENTSLREGSSKYTGVSLDTSCNKWKASIRLNGKSKHLGNFDNEKEASECYKSALKAFKEGSEIEVRHKKHYSKYKGVSFNKKENKFTSTFCKDYKRVFLGYFSNEIDAHNAYQDYKVKNGF